MTTRQALNRRFFLGFLYFIAFMIVLVIWQASAPQSALSNGLIRLVGLFSFAAVAWYRWQTPCQNCHKALTSTALLWRPAKEPLSSPLCPYCGISIDHDPARPPPQQSTTSEG
jgi:hypothetical protein